MIGVIIPIKTMVKDYFMGYILFEMYTKTFMGQLVHLKYCQNQFFKYLMVNSMSKLMYIVR